MGIRDKQRLIKEIIAAFDPAISFDGCHKIYLLLDTMSIRNQKKWGYGEDGSFLIMPAEATRGEKLDTINKWYEKSCSLRFVEAVRKVKGDPNDGYIRLVEQFEEE